VSICMQKMGALVQTNEACAHALLTPHDVVSPSNDVLKALLITTGNVTVLVLRGGPCADQAITEVSKVLHDAVYVWVVLFANLQGVSASAKPAACLLVTLTRLECSSGKMSSCQRKVCCRSAALLLA
jgi:hypothetical protein